MASGAVGGLVSSPKTQNFLGKASNMLFQSLRSAQAAQEGKLDDDLGDIVQLEWTDSDNESMEENSKISDASHQKNIEYLKLQQEKETGRAFLLASAVSAVVQGRKHIREALQDK